MPSIIIHPVDILESKFQIAVILLRDVTLALQEIEEFYSKGNPRQQVVDISVDKQANQLLFTPASV